MLSVLPEHFHGHYLHALFYLVLAVLYFALAALVVWSPASHYSHCLCYVGIGVTYILRGLWV